MKNNIVMQTDFYLVIIISLKLYLVSSAADVVSKQSATSMGRIKN